MITYEEYLNADTKRAFLEGSRHFERESRVHRTLERIAKRLDEIGVPYAVAGGMAMFFHGYRRFTEGVDILVTPEGLKKIHEELEGLGYAPPFEKSRHLRDTETGVKIEFLVTGGYPGDGKPKPVAFPDPAVVFVEIDGIRFVDLHKLIELKLASGTAVHRMKDLVDVQSMIERLNLPRDLSDNISPYVRDSYLKLWEVANSPHQEP